MRDTCPRPQLCMELEAGLMTLLDEMEQSTAFCRELVIHDRLDLLATTTARLTEAVRALENAQAVLARHYRNYHSSPKGTP